ncbi:MAG: OmpH family outer membrane protein [Bdellovibrio sp.]|nr:MAG: OmpH family outer membrane protein [Bdellovibrio sp.]
MRKQNFLIVLCGLLISSLALANVKIGYVDMQKVIQSTKAGKAARKKLEAEFKKRKKELEKKQKDIQRMGKDFEKKRLALSDDVKLKKQQELQQEMLKYQELVGKSQMEIQKKERELTLPIVKKARKIIQEIAKKEGYTMILEKGQGVLWGQKDVDLTDRVIKEYDKR